MCDKWKLRRVHIKVFGTKVEEEEEEKRRENIFLSY